MSDETAGAAHRGPDPLVTGKRVLLALGLWLLAAVVIGTATVFAARGSGAAAVTAIVVGEVYTLLIVALMIVFRPRAAQALGLVRCRRADVGLAFAACGGCVPHRGGDSIGCRAVALVELDRDLEGDGVR